MVFHPATEIAMQFGIFANVNSIRRIVAIYEVVEKRDKIRCVVLGDKKNDFERIIYT